MTNFFTTLISYAVSIFIFPFMLCFCDLKKKSDEMNKLNGEDTSEE